MKKLSIFLLAILAVLGLASCRDKSEPEQSEPEQSQPETDPITEEITYHLMGGNIGWSAERGVNVLSPTSIEELSKKAEYADLVTSLNDKSNIKGIYLIENVELNYTHAWTANANGEQIDGGFTVKVTEAKWSIDPDGDWISEYVNWNPDPHKSHVESLTDNLFMPKWVETPALGEEALGKWDDNPVVTSGHGKYSIVYVTYNAVSALDTPAAGLAAIKTDECDATPHITYHLMGGGIAGWTANRGQFVLNPTSVEDLAKNAAYADVADTLKTKTDITGVYMIEGIDYNYIYDWTANANGEQVDGGFTLKVTEAKWYLDEDGDWISDYVKWNPDPHKSHVESLTDNLFMPKWVEKAAEGEEGLGTWADNPVITSGHGKYTVIYVTYKAVSALDTPAAGLAVVKTADIEMNLRPSEKLTNELAGLKDGSITEPTVWELSGNVEALSINKVEGAYDVDLVITVDGVKVAVANAANIANVVCLEKGTHVSIKGAIDPAAELAEIDGVTPQIVLTGAEVNWSQEVTVTVRAPEGVEALNVYFWGSASNNPEWPGIQATKNSDGSFSVKVPGDIPNIIFNWEGGQTVDLVFDAEQLYWTIGEANEEGKYAATCEVVYHRTVTVKGIPAEALSADVYWWESNHDVNPWPGLAMTKNEDGSWTALIAEDIVLGETIIFSWLLGEDNRAQTINIVLGEADLTNPVWTIVEVEGGYSATSSAE